jgi:DNA polymerase V
MNVKCIEQGVTVESIYGFEKHTRVELPLYLAIIPAGFPSPADDYIDKKLDLNEFLVRHPAATFFVRVTGDSMIDAGIHSGDVLIVDRALEPDDNRIVIAALNGELTVKRIIKECGRLYLMPENIHFSPIEVTSEMQLDIWGVVTSVIHPL